MSTISYFSAKSVAYGIRSMVVRGAPAIGCAAAYGVALEALKIQNGDVKEENGVLKVKGTANTPYEKNLIWDKIKQIGGEKPTDIIANIGVADESVYHRHTVKSGETLGKIAKQYYDNASKYQAIFKANTHILKNPDLIHPGQVWRCAHANIDWLRTAEG